MIPIKPECDIKIRTRKLYSKPELSRVPAYFDEMEDVSLNPEGFLLSDELQLIPDRVAIYNSENEKYISTMSTRSAANLSTFSDFVDMLNVGTQNLITNDLIVDDRLWQNGSKFSRIVQFPDYKFKFRNESFNLTLWAWTSYSLHWAEQFIFGPICVRCLNGMYDGAWSIKARSKKNWSNKRNLGSDDILDAIDAFDKFPDQLENWSSKSVDDEKVKRIFKNTLAHRKNRLSEDHSELLMRELGNLWDDYSTRYGNNLYAVYQTGTHWASHPKTKSKVSMNVTRDRSELVSKMVRSEYFN